MNWRYSEVQIKVLGFTTSKFIPISDGEIREVKKKANKMRYWWCLCLSQCLFRNVKRCCSYEMYKYWKHFCSFFPFPFYSLFFLLPFPCSSSLQLFLPYSLSSLFLSILTSLFFPPFLSFPLTFPFSHLFFSISSFTSFPSNMHFVYFFSLPFPPSFPISSYSSSRLPFLALNFLISPLVASAFPLSSSRNFSLVSCSSLYFPSSPFSLS